MRPLDCSLSELMAEMMQGVSPLTRELARLSQDRKHGRSRVHRCPVPAGLVRPGFVLWPAMQTLEGIIA